MVETAAALAEALVALDSPVFARDRGVTRSHQFAIEANSFGGGQTAAKRLRQANILSCGIGLPIEEISGDLNGLRLGTPEIVRWGMGPRDMPEIAGHIAAALNATRPIADIARSVSELRSRFRDLHFMR